MEYSKNIQINDSYDVIVAGGGPAGCATAISASENGAKTLIIEATGCLGGMGTAGLVPSWAPLMNGEQIIYGGLAESIVRECKKYLPNDDPDNLRWVPIDAERLKLIYDCRVKKSGADVLFNVSITDAVSKNGYIKYLIVSGKNGLKAYSAKVFIDCTGDGDVCAAAGAEFKKGEDTTGNLQPATHCFIMAGIDTDKYKTMPVLHPQNKNSVIYKIADDNRYPHITDTHMCSQYICDGVVGFNAGHLQNVDNTNPISVSQSLIDGRILAYEIRDALAEYLPEVFGKAMVIETGQLMGVRETRRIIGDYVLNFDDYAARRTFKDEICRNQYYIDTHLSEEEREKEREGKFNIENRTFRYGKDESHGIPYRCLTPKKLYNVLTAGRIISCDRAVQGSIRVMPVCIATGEAAGIAATMAMENTVNVHNVDTDILRKKIRERNGYIL